MLKSLTGLSGNFSKIFFGRIQSELLNGPCCSKNPSKILSAFNQRRFLCFENDDLDDQEDEKDFYDDDDVDDHLIMDQQSKRVVDAEELEEREYSKFLASFNLGIHKRSLTASDNVLVVHPKIRWGEKSAPANTTPELQLEEAVTLCRTLPGFNVVSTVIVGTDYNTNRKHIWGEGRLNMLFNLKQENNVTAVVINVDMLSPLQQTELSAFFQAPVYDRYNLVLLIFKMYARTREANLQIALAEIPYIRHRMKYLLNNDSTPDALRINEAMPSLERGGADKMELLRLRQHSLRKKIRAVIASKSEELELKQDKGINKNRVIAVIGYTNAGKTTLIKKLTDSKTLFGENRLFATLDTSIHSAVLPSKNRIIFADTIGFISNLPIQLFASFSATLKHVLSADLLIHIQDLSHPNILAQRDNVFETLNGLKIRPELLKNIISVGNKIDRVPENLPIYLEKLFHDDSEMIQISCRNGTGMPKLIEKIDQSIMQISGSRLRRLRLSLSSKSIPYLYENDFVAKEPTPTECGNFLMFEVFMNDAQFAKFQANTGNKLKRKPKQAIENSL